MSQKKCVMGHFYDPIEFLRCPHCIPLADRAPYEGIDWSLMEDGPRNARRNRLFSTSLGTAPDGLPWALHIDRGPMAEELLNRAADELGFTLNAGTDRATQMNAATQSLQTLLDERDFASIDIAGDAIDCYIVSSTIPSMIGPTLFQRLIALTLPEITLLADATAPYIPGAQLAVPLDGSPLLVVKRTADQDASGPFQLVRRFSPESLAVLKSARFEGTVIDHELDEGFRVWCQMGDLEAYRTEVMHRIATAGRQPSCSVDRTELLATLADAADQLERLHKDGKVHGDLKPANLLVTEAGIHVIDSLDLNPLSQTTAMTPGWAAPEQLLGNDVLPSTDQYPIGLLVIALVGGQVENLAPLPGRFVMGRTVYSPVSKFDTTKLQPWLTFLDRCMRLDPRHRFPSMADLAGELRDLISRHPPDGQLKTWLTFGQHDSWDPDPKWTVKHRPKYERGVRVGAFR